MEANSDDGLLEIFGFKQGWHASFVMVDLISAKHIAQVKKKRYSNQETLWRSFHSWFPPTTFWSGSSNSI